METRKRGAQQWRTCFIANRESNIVRGNRYRLCIAKIVSLYEFTRPAIYWFLFLKHYQLIFYVIEVSYNRLILILLIIVVKFDWKPASERQLAISGITKNRILRYIRSHSELFGISFMETACYYMVRDSTFSRQSDLRNYTNGIKRSLR